MNKVRLALSTILVVAASGTHAQGSKSLYTSLDPSTCTLKKQETLEAEYSCPGPGATFVLMRIGEHKVFVSYGAAGTQEMVWKQGLPGTHRASETLEWVLADDEGGSAPTATILRYYIDRSAAKLAEEQVLVVTKIAPGNTCHIAFIDARRNSEANALARSAAAHLAPSFECATMDARSIGAMGVLGLPPGDAN